MDGFWLINNPLTLEILHIGKVVLEVDVRLSEVHPADDVKASLGLIGFRNTYSTNNVKQI